MVMLFCEEEVLVEGKELVEGNELVDAIELVEDDIDVETNASDDVTWDVDEINNDKSLVERLGKVIEVHPVKIPVTQVNKMIGWIVFFIEVLAFII